jgi:hypothetical protein
MFVCFYLFVSHFSLLFHSAEINFLLRQMGVLLSLNTLLENSTGQILNEAAQAVDSIGKINPNSISHLGYGFRESNFSFDILVRIKQDNYQNTGMAWKIWDAALWITQFGFEWRC